MRPQGCQVGAGVASQDMKTEKLTGLIVLKLKMIIMQFQEAFY